MEHFHKSSNHEEYYSAYSTSTHMPNRWHIMMIVGIDIVGTTLKIGFIHEGQVLESEKIKAASKVGLHP